MLLSASPPFRAAFTRIEFLTLLGILGVLSTLGISTVASARAAAQQVACTGNLQQIVAAVHRFSAVNHRRPRSLTRLADATNGWAVDKSLLCPADPALRGVKQEADLIRSAWGNLANESQDPGMASLVGEPESGSWQNELQERKETRPFSYLHPLGWNRSAWDRLQSQGSPMGVAVCQLHGVRVPTPSANPNQRTYMEFEGRILRAQTDGSVVRRKIFRDPEANGHIVTTASAPASDYPWDFYTDRVVPPLK